MTVCDYIVCATVNLKNKTLEPCSPLDGGVSKKKKTYMEHVLSPPFNFFSVEYKIKSPQIHPESFVSQD